MYTFQTSAMLCPFQRDYSSLVYTLSHPLNTVIYVDTAVLVIGSICYKKSFELLSRISEDRRHTDKELNISMPIFAFRSPLLCRKILSFYLVSAGLHQLLSENISITTWSLEVQTCPSPPLQQYTTIQHE